jgi:hypothetical protein
MSNICAGINFGYEFGIVKFSSEFGPARFDSGYDLVRFRFIVLKFSGNLTSANVKLGLYMSNAGDI